MILQTLQGDSQWHITLKQVPGNSACLHHMGSVTPSATHYCSLRNGHETFVRATFSHYLTLTHDFCKKYIYSSFPS